MSARGCWMCLSICFLVLSLRIYITQAAMDWVLLDDPEAVCNDYSRAGFFIENTGSSKWIIFLESGGLCYSAETCNERFFRRDVRVEFATNKDEAFFKFDPDFNFTKTWNTLESQNRNLSRRINPYMTSINTSIKDENRFSKVEGRDFLDNSAQDNPLFYDFNRVVVPYCSSDLWLAQDDFVVDGVNLTSADPQRQFLDNAYLPEADTLQFTFRGQTIFRSVIRQLLEKNRLSNATEVLLAGSSAGGLGVVNNIKWIMSEFKNNSVSANVSVLADSSWFINFRGNIQRVFDGESANPMSNISRRADMRLFNLIASIPQCVRLSPTGSPCCISLDCILLDEEYFPVGQIPVMIVFSVYDILLLGDAIARLIPPGGSSSSSGNLLSQGIEFVSAVTEYGGAMNYSILNTVSQVQQISFIATQCFQHIYFATSTLWGPDSILEDSSTEQLNVSLGQFTGSFNHSIHSGNWKSYNFSDNEPSNNSTSLTCDTSEAHTMQEAVEMWYRCRYTTDSLQFRDTCHSVHCHDYCPDRVDLLRIEPDRYPNWSVILVVCIVAMITAISVVMKISFGIWRYILYRKQNGYLDRIELDEEDVVDGLPQFPVCGLEEAVSVACLDLKYSVTYFRKKKTKDESRDSTSIAFAIAQHIDEEEEDVNNFNRSSTRRSSRSVRSMKNRTVSEGGKPSIPTVNTPQNEQRPPLGHLGVIREENGDSKLDDKLNQDNHEKQVFFRQDTQDQMDDMDYEEVDSGSETKNKSSCFRGEFKKILKGISIYFNPGELVGIMGPSGSGKTTFLDLLTGRRRTGQVEGEIFVNGIPLDRIRDEYVSFTGYVLQLATPYYEELTVRENVTLAAHMKLSRKLTWREKFERVEQVIDITGLTNVSDFVVGGLSGPGLSGGQKKRLIIALQLLTMPKVIFLDEPTSGLDATASVEILSHLNRLADSNRTVVLTIHQPRLEIFFMFHKLILLSDGKIAYHGVPQKAFGFFAEAAVNSFLNMNLEIPQIGEHNPADIIMDMLGKPLFRRAILHHYQESTEPELIKWAIKRARMKDFESMSIATLDSDLEGSLKKARSIPEPSPYQIQKTDFVKNATAGWFHRLAVLETRADKRSTLTWNVYLPVIFFGYGLLLGTVYFQQDQPLLIMAGFCVYSVASALFMFPVMQNYFGKALEVYKFENNDGAGRATDIVFQGVSRFVTMAIIPVVLCSLVLYLLLVKREFWSLSVYLQLVVIGMALNQTWIALLTSLLCALPNLAFRLSPVISSIAGFSSGFFIPRDDTPWLYRWIFYINPNYYGFSAAANVLLKDINDDCGKGNSILECYFNSGVYILQKFGFDDIRPYMNIAVLLLMTLLYLGLAVLSNWVRHTNFFIKMKAKIRPKKTFMDQEEEYLLGEEEDDEERPDEKKSQFEEKGTVSESLLSEKESLELPSIRDTAPSPFDDDVFESHTSPTEMISDETPKKSTKDRWIRFATDSLEKKDDIEMEPVRSKHGNSRPQRIDFRQRKKRKRIQSVFLDNQEHAVFMPGASQSPKTPGMQFANLVYNLIAQNQENTSPSPAPTGNSLKERREMFEWSIKQTQEVVKEHTEELIHKPDEVQAEKVTFRDVTRKLQERLKQENTPKLATVVGQLLEKNDTASSAPTSIAEDEEGSSIRQRNASTTSAPNVGRKKRRQRNESAITQKFLDIGKKRTPSSKSIHSPTSPSPKYPALRKTSTFADFDHQRSQKKYSFAKRNTETSLPLSETKTTNSCSSSSSSSGFPYLAQTSPSGTGLTSNVGDLDDIEEDIGEIEDEYVPKPVKLSFLSVPNIRVSDPFPSSHGETGTGGYQKISDSGSSSHDQI